MRASSPRSRAYSDEESASFDRYDNDRLLRQLPDTISVRRLSIQDHNNMTHRESKSWIFSKRCISESLDFDEMESVVWRKHQLRRFFQDRGNWWTGQRRTTAYKWALVVVTGIVIGVMGYGVSTGISYLTKIKFSIATSYLSHDKWANSFFSLLTISLIYAIAAACLCWIEPAAAGSGIPEIKAFLNGVNLNRIVRIKVLYTKVLGMVLSVSSGLPLGKEGPMIHTGSIVGAAVSQGKTMTFGFDTAWSKFQDLRNDRSKRDFVTFGASAGVAAAFAAPIGGILFTLEEGASFWSTSLTFRSFFCALMTLLTISILFQGDKLGRAAGGVGFQFGIFDDSSFFMYELFIFGLIGVTGGVFGAIFNRINEHVTLFRMHNYKSTWQRMLEVLVLTGIWTTISFIAPLMWQSCTPVPTQTASWTTQQYNLMQELVQFQCPENTYNEVASLYFVNADVAIKQLFHFQEAIGATYVTFSTGSLLMFMIPYFLMAAVVSGTFVPAGLFVPTLTSGAAYGRLIGHILNRSFPGQFSTSGTYALIGASAILGGMSRMTIAGAVIVLEACGNSTFLLPLMITFAAARYAGNAINEPMYDMQIRLKEMPFLEGSLRTLGLLNYHPVAEIMATPVVTLNEIMKVDKVYELLKATSHNGFPVVNKSGHLRGLILRKTLCSLLKHKIFSVAMLRPQSSIEASTDNGDRPSELKSSTLSPVATLFHDTLERNYPRFTKIDEIQLEPEDMKKWLDVRPYMDTSPFSINISASVSRSYRFFRTMGLRHLIVLDGEHKVAGIITRQDLTEHRLEHHWFHEGDHMQKFLNVDPVDLGQFQPSFSELDVSSSSQDIQMLSSISPSNGDSTVYVPPALPQLPTPGTRPTTAAPPVPPSHPSTTAAVSGATSSTSSSAKSKAMKEPKTMS